MCKNQNNIDFYFKYNLIKQKSFELKDDDIPAGIFETYGKDIKYVLKQCKKNIKNIWTVVDGDDGNLWITAGMHYCNRIHYIITKEEWKDKNEVYRY